MVPVSEQETRPSIGFSTMVTESEPKRILLFEYASLDRRLAEDYAAEHVKASRHSKTAAYPDVTAEASAVESQE